MLSAKFKYNLLYRDGIHQIKNLAVTSQLGGHRESKDKFYFFNSYRALQKFPVMTHILIALNYKRSM